jgi:hypothetical protein
MKITQAILGNGTSFFLENFLKKWQLKPYYDTLKPVVFFGIYGQQHLYESHKGYKIFLPTTPEDLKCLNGLSNHSKTFIAPLGLNMKGLVNSKEIIITNENIELKDYSRFQPNLLGDKVYFYSGFKNGWSNRWGEELIDEIQKNIDFEIITTSHLNGKDYFDINFLKNNYYDKSFLNLNLSKDNGMTTVREMGLMGRKTITMRTPETYKYNCIINCNNIEDIITTIKHESKKIGTIQSPIDTHTVNNEWLDLNYWLKNWT